MPTETKTWQILDGKLEAITSTMVDERRTEAYDLETWIASNPSIVGPDLAIIGRQVSTRSGPLDLLAVDQSGNVVIIELKRDILPREALAQAIDYASDVASWDIEKIDAVCARYSKRSLEDVLSEQFIDIDLEGLSVNETQRVVLVGFSIEPALERMIAWLSDNYSVNVNAVVLNYVRTNSGEELLTRTSVISEDVEQQRARKRKIQISMSDVPGEYELHELEERLSTYLSEDLKSAARMRNVLFPVCLERGTVGREEIKQEMVTCGEAPDLRRAGLFLSLISQQVGLEKNDFLRQVIGYGYPEDTWKKDNYHIKDEYRELVARVLQELDSQS